MLDAKQRVACSNQARDAILLRSIVFTIELRRNFDGLVSTKLYHSIWIDERSRTGQGRHPPSHSRRKRQDASADEPRRSTESIKRLLRRRANFAEQNRY